MRRHSRQGHLTARLERIQSRICPPVSTRQRPTEYLVSRRLSGASRAALIRHYGAGSSIKGLARQFGLSEYSVRQVLVSGGVKSYGDAATSSQVREIVAMRNDATPLDSIAKAVGLSVGTIRIVLAGHGCDTDHAPSAEDAS